MHSADFSAAQNIAARQDSDIASVKAFLLRLDPDGRRFAAVLRDTIDQLLDGENTGRFDWNSLHKTEKTHAGTLVEINLQREFGFAGGTDMDYLIESIEVDCKFSQKPYGWMIPPEALDEVCLVVWADDYKSQWSAGLMRAERERLTVSRTVTKKGNRDGKYRLTKEHHSMVHWLWKEQALRKNILLHLEEPVRQAIFSAGCDSRRGRGQARVNALFRLVQQEAISRTVVRTVAQQKDYMKRVRYDGGARTHLRSRGIIILGDQKPHQTVAAELGVPIPHRGEFVSVRVAVAKTRHDGQPRTLLGGRYWVAAMPGDPEEAAPILPTTKKTEAPE